MHVECSTVYGDVVKETRDQNLNLYIAKEKNIGCLKTLCINRGFAMPNNISK
jgi:hypothetical protein